MKRSVNFNGMKKWRGATAHDFIATCRMLGMTDDEIAKALEDAKAAEQQRAADLGLERCPKCDSELANGFCESCKAAFAPSR